MELRRPREGQQRSGSRRKSIKKFMKQCIMEVPSQTRTLHDQSLTGQSGAWFHLLTWIKWLVILLRAYYKYRPRSEN